MVQLSWIIHQVHDVERLPVFYREALGFLESEDRVRDRSPIKEVRDELIARGVEMGEIKQCPGLAGPLCDGQDPEGSVFKLAETDTNG